MLAIRRSGLKLGDEVDYSLISELARTRRPEQRFIRGVFAGGTFCYQSQQILRAHQIEVWSNSPIDKRYSLRDPDRSQNHTLVDMGDDIYTRGRPHPMIDGSQRARRIIAEVQDPTVAVILLDFILGYNSSMDPVNDLLPAIHTAQKIAAGRGAKIVFAASITGTELDPQGYDSQERVLRDAGGVHLQEQCVRTEFCMNLPGVVRWTEKSDPIQKLLNEPLVAINLGLEGFGEAIQVNRRRWCWWTGSRRRGRSRADRFAGPVIVRVGPKPALGRRGGANAEPTKRFVI